MYSGSKPFACAIIYIVVISWKGATLAHRDSLTTGGDQTIAEDPAAGNDVTIGDTPANGLTVNNEVDRSELFNIVYGALNDARTSAARSTINISLSNPIININSLVIGGCSDPKTLKNKTQENDVPIYKYVREDYTPIQNFGFYKLHTRKLNWFDAYKACVAENAHLVIINSVKEVAALRELRMVNEDIQLVYVGAHDMFREGQWITVFGESLEKAGYDVWARGEPNNADGNEHCAILRKSGEMNDIPCSHEEYYICEISFEHGYR